MDTNKHYNPRRGIHNFNHRMKFVKIPVRLWKGPNDIGVFEPTWSFAWLKWVQQLEAFGGMTTHIPEKD